LAAQRDTCWQAVNRDPRRKPLERFERLAVKEESPAGTIMALGMASALAAASPAPTLAQDVSKRKDSAYRSGRSSDWLKMKNAEAPAVKREEQEEWGRDKWRSKVSGRHSF
jgi:hypothetical protein